MRPRGRILAQLHSVDPLEVVQLRPGARIAKLQRTSYTALAAAAANPGCELECSGCEHSSNFNMRLQQLMTVLESLGSEAVRQSQAQFGIRTDRDRAHGITTPQLKALARRLGRSHELAAELWNSGVLEARILAALVEDPAKVTRAQMDRWARAFDNWGVCDACCCYVFRKTPFARAKAIQWSSHKDEFVKRAGFALMAYLAVHDKKSGDHAFAEWLPIIERESDDDRPFVRKAVNWALRQIGKRSARLNALAIARAEAIKLRGTRSARWIASDALRELRGPNVRSRLGLKDDRD
jgi:3-methyladenine DNA glycosylase AlkD